ncbi:hypothetical protein [Kangiella spongicola]|jgi:hypothetical protein|uniref:Uncharacterized protein n=1 Tax=Kangiella spongicola TaxID=796379 RepID=A0A318D427_9GAMM|nr:hypothetical protein [Kangiella spongicola]PXF64066.1 hypothetical protein DL796_02690 [Kangiella spongicola]
MSGSKEAVELATHLPEIGFPEFTTKLVSDVFDSLIASNLRQTEAYVELLKQTSKNLKTFINDTRDDISGEMLLQFLGRVLGADSDNNNPDLKIGDSLTAQQASSLNDALEVKDADIASDNKVAAAGNVTENKFQSILDAVANRLAADKYTLLKEMVKQGLLRLVVENGEIETRLTFNTYGSSYYQNRTTDYQRKDFNFRAKAKTGGLLSGWVKASASTAYNSVKISTATKTDVDRSSSSVQIYGRVFINFKTDYLPLDQNEG